MKPISFPDQNLIFGENQEGVQPLPAHFNKELGVVTTLWELDEQEVESIKTTRCIMLECWTFGGKLQPVNLLTIHENERRQKDGES
jgi:hypothetical protein